MARTLEVQLLLERRTPEITIPNTRLHNMYCWAVIGTGIQGISQQVYSPKWSLYNGLYRSIYDSRMPAELAQRLDSFGYQYYVENCRGFNCFGFMRYMNGWPEPEKGFRAIYEGPSHDPYKTSAFMPYAILRGGMQGQLMHGLISIENGLSLSVFGNDSIMIMAPTAVLMEVYGGDTLMQVQRLAYYPY